MPTSVRTPWRVLAPWWVLLTLLAFLQSPGRTVADTKHDLTENPLGFLAASLNMWSEQLPLGQLQNQSYGYLFPQGPFFALFSLIDDSLLPDWIAQATWWSLLLCLGFTGAYKLAEAAGIGSHPARIVAALAYALSPRIITTLGAISSEAWPVALAPWIALPLLRILAYPEALPRRALVRGVGLSALAVLATGAVNAVSTAAACIPAGLIVLFYGSFGPQRRRAWAVLPGWLLACALVSLWWIIPLLLLGAYAAPFTDYIESSGVTTKWLNLAEAVRGTTSWTPFVSVERVGGNALVTEPILIYATLALAVMSLFGLAPRTMPQRRMWLSMALIGLIIMASWTQPFGLWWQPGQQLLDAQLAALRNLHKFDVVARLAMTMGLAHLLSRLPWPAFTRAPQHVPTGQVPAGGKLATPGMQWLHPERYPRAVAAMLSLVVLLAATAPAWSGRLAPAGSFAAVPAHWQQAAAWLNSNATSSRTLLLPSAPFGNQTWGNTRDEPLQPLAEVPWVVRDAIPLVPPEAIRNLDGLRESLTAGAAVPALADTLLNQGIGHIVVRHDLADSRRADSLSKIQATLGASAGLARVAEFADNNGAAAIEIWQVGSAAQRQVALEPRIIDSAQLPLVTGGPEVLARLDRISGDAPARLLVGSGAGTITDTPARRGRNYGEIVGAESGILAASEDPEVPNLVPDYPVAGVPLVQTGTGRAQLEASSSASQPFNVGGARPQHSLNALVDGDDTTWWEPLTGKNQAEWLQLTLAEPVDGALLTLTGARVPVKVRVLTDNASTSTQLLPGEPARIPLPGGPTREIKITATVAPLGFAVSELRLQGPQGEELTPVRVPVVPDSSPNVQRFAFGQEIPEGTMVRLFTLPGPRTLTVDADTCRILDDPWAQLSRPDGSQSQQLECGQQVELAAGTWRLDAKSGWLTLTSSDYFAPDAAAQNISYLDQGKVPEADTDRVLWIPSSVNRGRELKVGGQVLEPITVNGWQQGWVVPAGVHGPIDLSYPPAATWRNAIIAGGVVAAVVAALALLAGFAWRRLRPETVADGTTIGPDVSVGPFVVLAAAAMVLTSSWPGALVAATTAGAAGLWWVWLQRLVGVEKRARLWRRGVIVAGVAAFVAASITLARTPWPAADYAGDSWLLQLLMVAGLSVVSGYAAVTRPQPAVPTAATDSAGSAD